MLTSCNHKPLYIIMFGAPGSGKGTMAGLLSKKYNIPQLSVGEMLRKSLDSGNKAGKDADIFMKKGRLVPDELINKIVDSNKKWKEQNNFRKNINYKLDCILSDKLNYLKLAV